MLRPLTNSLQTTALALWGNKIRSALTMLGVIIGVFSIITLIGLGEGIKKDITKEITQLGSNILFVLSGKVQTADGGINPAAAVGASTLTDADLKGIQEVPHVVDTAAIGLVAGIPVSDEGVEAQGTIIMAVEPSFFDYATIYKIVAGRYFTDAENVSHDRVLALGKEAAAMLYPSLDPASVVGKTVMIGKEAYVVMGIFEITQSTSLFSSSSGKGPGAVMIPFATAKEVNPTTQIFRIGVKVDESADAKAVAKDIRGKLQELHGVDDTTVFTQDDLVKVIDNVLSLITKAIVGLASISLVVGGIGIMNIMLVSVTERTKEIGLRKAVGASNRAILGQFLTEAIVLSLLGGAIGVIISSATGVIVKQQAGLTILVDARSVGIALLFSVAVGVIFGVAPAIRAARLNPIDALRYE